MDYHGNSIATRTSVRVVLEWLDSCEVLALQMLLKPTSERMVRKHRCKCHMNGGVSGTTFELVRALWTPILLDNQCLHMPSEKIVRGKDAGQ